MTTPAGSAALGDQQEQFSQSQIEYLRAELTKLPIYVAVRGLGAGELSPHGPGFKREDVAKLLDTLKSAALGVGEPLKALLETWRERVSVCRRISQETIGDAALSRRWDEEAVDIETCADELAQALSAVSLAPATTGWQPISTAPKDGTRILTEHNGDVAITRWCGCGGGHWSPVFWHGEEAAFWMPLPSLPAPPSAAESGTPR